jgi:vancomycin permeability regulator SanA
MRKIAVLRQLYTPEIMIKKTLLIITLLYCTGIAAIWLDGATTGYEKSEYAVVLGNQVYPSGEPSERLKARLNRAAELFRAGTVAKIIVSGGLGKEGHDEATVMKQYLEIQGIPPTALIADSFGNNTRLTAQNAHQWAKTDKSIIVVSQLYHVSRAKMAFEQGGFTHVGVAYPHYFEWRDVLASLRELPAWISYWFGMRDDGHV